MEDTSWVDFDSLQWIRGILPSDDSSGIEGDLQGGVDSRLYPPQRLILRG